MSFVGAATQNVTTAAASVTVSTGLPTILANDIAIIVAAAGLSNAKTFPTGFTSTFSGITQLAPTSPASQEWHDVRWGICAGGESSFQVTGPSTLWAAIVLIYRGRNTSALLTASAQTAVVAASSYPISASFTGGITAASGDDVLLVGTMGGFQSGSPATSFTTPPTNFVDKQTTGSLTNSLATIITCDYPNNPGGALGATLAATIGGQTGGGQTCGYGGWIVCLAASPTTAPPPQRWDQLGAMGVQVAQ